MYQVVYFKNSRSLYSSLKPEYVVKSYSQFNIAVYNDEIFSFNSKTMKRIITSNDITLIPTGYLIVKSDDWEAAYSHFLSQRNSILVSDKDDGRIVVEIPYETTIEKFLGDTTVLPFVTTCVVDYIFEVTPLSTKFDREERVPRYPNIPYNDSKNWALQNANCAEAWSLIDQNAKSNSPVTVTMFDTRVDTGHPDLQGKIDPTSVNYMAIYENNTPVSTYDNGTTNWVNVNTTFIEYCGQYNWNFSGYFNSTAGVRLRHYLHGTGVAGILGGSNSNNVLMSSPSNDCVNIRVAVVVDVFRNDMNCTQLRDLLGGSNAPTFSTTLAWEMALSKESYYYQPNTVAYVLGWDLSNADSFVRNTLFNIFSNRLQYNRQGRGAALFVAHGNDNENQSGLLSEAPVHAGDDNTYYVSASNIQDSKGPWSNYGIYNYIAAPGHSVLTASVRGKYGDPNLGETYTGGYINQNLWVGPADNYDLKIAYGTSISAAFVAAIYATMVYVRPTLTNFQAINILEETSRKVGDYFYDESGRSDELGYGIIDHEAAIQAVIDLGLVTYDWPGGEPIEVNITDSPAEIYDQFTIGGSEYNAPPVEFVVDILNPEVVPLVRKITSSVYICDEEWFDYPNSCVLVGQRDYIITAQTNTDDSILTSVFMVNNCELSTGSKQIFVKSQIFGYGDWPLSYGIASDNVGVNVISGDDSPYIQPHSQWCALNGISLEYLGLVAAGNGQSTTNASGVYWKFRISMPTPPAYPYNDGVYGATIRILKWNETTQSWDWATLARQIVWEGQVYDDINTLQLNPANPQFGTGMTGGDTRERLFIFHDVDNILGQLIGGLPVQMRAEIAFVKIGFSNGNYQSVVLTPLVHGTNIGTEFTISSWPGLTSPTGSIAG